ncbi:MAG: glutamate 5-kinase [Bacteroidales bacterium]|nr:glutamate 5-kinase [Bacteroidales bacterium]
MEHRQLLKNKEKIVVKIGTSSLTCDNGQINYEKFEKLANTLSRLQSEGKKVMLVTSGAIAVGSRKMGRAQRPDKLAEKQAMAAIGQAELIKIYEEFFSKNKFTVAQVLLTKDVVTHPIRRQNAKNTLNTLLNMQVIPIINENDTVSTDEIEFGDNDTLSAYVAVISEADLLIILSDIDGLYDGDPRIDENAKIISRVNSIDVVEKFAHSTQSEFARGGMITKIAAAKLCNKAGIDMVIALGSEPDIIFDILGGKDVGTLFVAQSATESVAIQQPLVYRDKLG